MDGVEIILSSIRHEEIKQKEEVKEQDDFLQLQSMVSHMDNGVIYGKEE